jgi:hypothetical protein
MRRRHDWESQVLVQSTAERPLDQRLGAALAAATATGVQRLLVGASRHGVTGFVGRSLLGLPGLSSVLRTGVEQAHNRVLRDHLRTLGELAVVGPALDDLGTPWLVLKGPALAQTSYPLPHLREYVDLDLLVPSSGLHAALSRLADVGCRIVDRPWRDLRRERAGEVSLVSPAGVLIDLHWELANDWRVREAFRLPPAEDLLGRATAIDLGTMEVLTLDAVDSLLHVALHACTSGGWRLLWLKDVAQAHQRTTDQDAEVRARARAWQVELVLAAMLARTRRVLGTPELPGPAVDRRVATSWLRLLAAVDAVSPVARATGAGSLTRIVTNSTRRTTTGSAAELTRRSVAFAVQRAVARAPRRSSQAS